MYTYRITEADFKVPDDWVDQSLNIFKLPAGGAKSEASIVISRDAAGAETPFDEYMKTQVENGRKQLPGFTLISQESRSFAGVPAATLEFTWHREHKTLSFHQIFIRQPKLVLILTLTTTPEDYEYHYSDWHEMLTTFTLQQR